MPGQACTMSHMIVKDFRTAVRAMDAMRTDLRIGVTQVRHTSLIIASVAIMALIVGIAAILTARGSR